MSKKHFRPFMPLAALSLVALLAACESSTGGSNVVAPAVDAPTTPVEPTLIIGSVKNFNFTWTDVADATYYQLLENADGSSGFSQVGDDIVAGVQSVDHIVPLYARTNASYIISACNNIGCTDSSTLTVGDNINDGIGYFKASNPDAGDEFGVAVSLSDDGTLLAIGAPFEDSNTTGINGDDTNNDAGNSGAVFVFSYSDSVWQQQAYLKASSSNVVDVFGTALSLSGDGTTLAVGALDEDSNATGINGDDTNHDAPNSGAVYVFTLDGTGWNQQAYLKASNTDDFDGFGVAVSLSDDGNTLAIGGPFEDSNATGVDGDGTYNDEDNSGAVYVFSRSGTSWSQQAYLKASNTETGDLFGMAVDLSGDGTTLVVGSPGEDSNATTIGGVETNNDASSSGAVYLFGFDGTAWSQQAYIKANNTNGGDSFGITVSLSDDGNTLATGARLEDSNANGIDGDGTNNDAASSGAVYLFSRSGTSWSQQAYLKASNTDAFDNFGVAVSLSDDGTQLAVSSTREDSSATGINSDQLDNTADDSGAVYLFRLTDGTWAQTAYLKASNTGEGDMDSSNVELFFGASQVNISLSGDGETLAVGNYNEDSSATGIGGDQTDNSVENSGAVYLY